MADVSGELLEKVQTAYQNWLESDPEISKLYARVKEGKITFQEAHKFAEISGNYLAKAFGLIETDMLPDGKMYYNIAMDVVLPACEMNHDVVSDLAYQVMKITNEKAGVPLGAKIAKMGKENVLNIIDKITSYDNYDDAKWLLQEPIVNASIKIVDDTIAANADFQLKAGIDAVIQRVSMGNCCDWCKSIAGVYNYSDVKNKGNDVFRRHNYCRCMVLYKDANRLTNAHSKIDYADHKAAMQSWQENIKKQTTLTSAERLAKASSRRKK